MTCSRYVRAYLLQLGPCCRENCVDGSLTATNMSLIDPECIYSYIQRDYCNEQRTLVFIASNDFPSHLQEAIAARR